MNTKFWKGKKVLLTGHTGFKGSWMSIWLQSMGAELTGFSNSIPTKPSLFESAEVSHGMTSINGDICDYDKIHSTITEYKPEIVIHMAAQSLVRESYQNPIKTYATNVMGTVNLFEAIRKEDTVRVIVNVTSDKCYENRELDRGYSEDDPMGGYDPYSNSKGCSELVTSSFRNSFFNPSDYSKHRVALASVRAGNVIGGGDWSQDRLIPDLVRGILGHSEIKIRNPSAIRPWQFVLDPLEGYLLLTEKLWENGIQYVGGWNFGPSDMGVKPVKWIVDKFLLFWGKNLDWNVDSYHQPHEEKILKLDCTKASTQLGWSTRTSMEKTLQNTVEWYKQFEQKNNMRKFTEEQIMSYMGEIIS